MNRIIAFLVMFAGIFLIGGGLTFFTAYMGRPQPTHLHDQIRATPYVIMVYAVATLAFLQIYLSAPGLKGPKAFWVGCKILGLCAVLFFCVFALEYLLISTYRDPHPITGMAP